MAKIVYYDKENDIFSIHRGFTSDEKFKGNIDAGQLILDVSTSGKIRGIEVMNASKFFLDVLNKYQINLEDVSNADFRASSNPSGIFIALIFKGKNLREEVPAQIMIPTRNLRIS